MAVAAASVEKDDAVGLQGPPRCGKKKKKEKKKILIILKNKNKQ